ncbi:MAG: sporulation protein YqfD [Ruminococcus sp.]|nr:sporulation protein YqfD [Ruminococcus sp.]MCM1479592.1 sporulation protein YqfD [Muribaculaceae bacterium]
MMFNDIRGIISFEAIAPEPESFVNRLKECPAVVTNLRCKGNRLTGDVYRSDFEDVRRTALEENVQISISERRGKIFTVRKYRLRAGLAVGFALAVLLVAYLSNVVMSIKIFGTESISDEQVEALLNGCGIRIGAFIPSIDLREAERRVVAESAEISWIGIRSSGCIIEAEITEADKPPETVPTRTPCNVVSARDAEIVSIDYVYMGMLVPMLHDGVQKGEILISGTVEDGKGGIYYTHAMGKIIGRYDEKVTFFQPYAEENQVYAETVTRKTLNFFGLKIPLYVGRNNFDRYEYDEKTSFLKIFNIQLPIGITCSEYKLYETETEEISPEKAARLLEEKINLCEKNFYEDEDIKIIGREVFFSETEEGMSAAVKYTLEGDIGVTKEIMAKEPYIPLR